MEEIKPIDIFGCGLNSSINSKQLVGQKIGVK
jgi:hypothetical protein